MSSIYTFFNFIRSAMSKPSNYKFDISQIERAHSTSAHPISGLNDIYDMQDDILIYKEHQQYTFTNIDDHYAFNERRKPSRLVEYSSE